MPGQPLRQTRLLLQIALDERGGARDQLAPPRREVIEHRDVMSRLQQHAADVAAQKAGATSNQHAHECIVAPGSDR